MPASQTRASSICAEPGGHLGERAAALVAALQRGQRHRVAQRARGDRVALGLVAVEQLVGRDALDDLGELPAEVHGVLHAEAQPLPARRVVDVRGVTGQQHAAVAVACGLPGHVGEARDPGGVVDAEVGAVGVDQRAP